MHLRHASLALSILLSLAGGTCAAADFHVAPGGSDANAGTSTNAAWRTLGHALNRLGAGDTLWIAGGTYRGKVVITNRNGRVDAPITVKPRAGETVLIKGSREATGWVPVSNGVWRIPAWNTNSQQVFVNGESMQMLGWPSEYLRQNTCGCGFWLYFPFGQDCSILTADGGLEIPYPVPNMPAKSFYYHKASGELFLRPPNGVDPNAALVEASTENGILFDESQQGGFHFEDLTFMHSCTMAYTAQGWPGVKLGPNSRLKRCVITETDAVGLGVYGNNTVVEDCLISRNGMNGITYSGSTNVLIRGCTIQYNNTRGFDLNYAAGIKIIPDGAATIEFCDVSYNYGPGIWFDTCNSGAPIIIRNNTVIGNTSPPVRPTSTTSAGIFIEISRNAEVYNNLVVSNAHVGIAIAGSADCRVYHNVVTGTRATPGGFRGVHAIAVYRGSTGFPTDNVEVFNNLVHDNATDYDANAWRQNGYLTRRVRMDGNLYHRSAQANPVFAYGSGVHVGLAAWRNASGFDLNSLSAPPQVDASYRPLATSPLRDAGIDSHLLVLDRAGGSRRIDANGDGSARPDIGAYEWMPASAVTRYVNPASASPTPPFSTPATAAATLAQAMAVAQPGDIVELSPGDHAVPQEITAASALVLRGAGTGGPATLVGGASNRILRVTHAGVRVENLGFRGGRAATGGAVRLEAGLLSGCRFEDNRAESAGGAVHATGGIVQACSFTGNRSEGDGGGAWIGSGAALRHGTFNANSAAHEGGGACLAAGAVAEENTFAGNSARLGGGFRAAGATVSGGRLSGNTAAQDGGGAHLDANAVMRRVRVAGNTAGNRGGGLAADGASTRLENLLVTANQAATAGGAWLQAGRMESCTLSGNTATVSSGGLRLESAASAAGVIAWHNSAPNQPDAAWASGATVDHSSAPVALPGSGNLQADPRFINRTAGDYRLGWDSPCIDAGQPSGAPAEDLDLYARPRNGNEDQVVRADIGAFENVSVHYVDAASPAPAEPYENWSTASRSISAAIDTAKAGDLILVAPGTYNLTGTIFVYRGIRIRSVSGPFQTILDGGNAVRCLEIGHGNAVVEGFTLQRGRATAGAGVYIRGAGTLRNCILTNNEATGNAGGQFSFLTNNFPIPCQIGRDSTIHEGGGGAVLSTGGILENCVIHGNRGAYAAGVLAARGGTLRHCTVVANTATVQGGGVVLEAGGTIAASIVYHNAAGAGTNLWIRGAGASVTTTCSIPLPAGAGNVDGDPLLGPSAQGYRPGVLSPVIDRANGNPVLSTDIAGNARPVDGNGDGLAVPDMGAWEITPTPQELDPDQDGLNNAAESVHGTQPTVADTDGDGVPDGEEVNQNTAPLDALSWLRMQTPLVNEATGITLRWRSVSNRVYHLARTQDLPGGVFTGIATNLPATPPVNQALDPGATGPGPYFYRITSDPAP